MALSFFIIAASNAGKRSFSTASRRRGRGYGFEYRFVVPFEGVAKALRDEALLHTSGTKPEREQMAEGVQGGNCLVGTDAETEQPRNFVTQIDRALYWREGVRAVAVHDAKVDQD